VMVIVPLRSIAEEQVRNNEFDLKAAHLSLDEEKPRTVASGEVQVLYASAVRRFRHSFEPPFFLDIFLVLV